MLLITCSLLPIAASAERDAALFGLSLNWALVANLQQQVEWARDTGQTIPAGEVDVLSWIERAPLAQVAPAAIGIPPPVHRSREP